MAFEITFSKKAERDFEDILNYIDSDFGTKAAFHFKDIVIDFTVLIQSFPEIGSLEQADKNIRAFVVHKRLKIFYQIDTNEIVILRLFDTRQRPDKR
ncbi:MAG: type II toxin-antitoxin system RelE/ParE family toxin [Mucilaginibacter sp.]|nr:type II toxin-antitoxin system RelE/ParE family toxin [Mucilaginibacter sp.]